jgi:hypothetical protein
MIQRFARRVGIGVGGTLADRERGDRGLDLVRTNWWREVGLVDLNCEIGWVLRWISGSRRGILEGIRAASRRCPRLFEQGILSSVALLRQRGRRGRGCTFSNYSRTRMQNDHFPRSCACIFHKNPRFPLISFVAIAASNCVSLLGRTGPLFWARWIINR